MELEPDVEPLSPDSDSESLDVTGARLLGCFLVLSGFCFLTALLGGGGGGWWRFDADLLFGEGSGDALEAFFDEVFLAEELFVFDGFNGSGFLLDDDDLATGTGVACAFFLLDGATPMRLAITELDNLAGRPRFLPLDVGGGGCFAGDGGSDSPDDSTRFFFLDSVKGKINSES